MKVTVTDDCISCGLCVDMCPDVFDMDEKAMPKINPVPAESEECAREAAEACPVDAIEVQE